MSRIAGFIYDAAISRGDRLVANADGMVELPADNPNSRNGSSEREGTEPSEILYFAVVMSF